MTKIVAALSFTGKSKTPEQASKLKVGDIVLSYFSNGDEPLVGLVIDQDERGPVVMQNADHNRLLTHKWTKIAHINLVQLMYAEEAKFRKKKASTASFGRPPKGTASKARALAKSH